MKIEDFERKYFPESRRKRLLDEYLETKRQELMDEYIQMTLDKISKNKLSQS